MSARQHFERNPTLYHIEPQGKDQLYPPNLLKETVSSKAPGHQ